MALRDQPYFPLYVNDFLSDEKLGECSAESTGVYIRLLCIMHKSEEYGTIKLKEKDKITSKSIANFSNKLSKLMPYDVETVERSLEELLLENVIKMEGDKIWQPRMVKDGHISEVRAKAGSAGGKSVRDIATKRKYNKPGYLYIVEDCDDELCHKVGISKDPKTRLQQIRSKSKRDMKIVRLYEVDDMGATEDNVLTKLQSIRDGEWIYGVQLSTIVKIVESAIDKITSKSQANSENEYEYENENENDSKTDIVQSTDKREKLKGRKHAREEEENDRFDDFWKAYPKKTGDIREAYLEYRRAVDTVSPETLISAINQQIKGMNREDFHYLPSAEKWLRNKGWLAKSDFPEQEKKQNEPQIQAFTPPEKRMQPINWDDIVEWPPRSGNYMERSKVPKNGAN